MARDGWNGRERPDVTATTTWFERHFHLPLGDCGPTLYASCMSEVGKHIIGNAYSHWIAAGRLGKVTPSSAFGDSAIEYGAEYPLQVGGLPIECKYLGVLM